MLWIRYPLCPLLQRETFVSLPLASLTELYCLTCVSLWGHTKKLIYTKKCEPPGGREAVALRAPCWFFNSCWRWCCCRGAMWMRCWRENTNWVATTILAQQRNQNQKRVSLWFLEPLCSLITLHSYFVRAALFLLCKEMIDIDPLFLFLSPFGDTTVC